MTEPTPIDLPVGLRWVKLVCRLGTLVTDSAADADPHPDLLPVSGTLTLAASPSRVRIQEADGRWRSVEVAGRTYNIRANGELVDGEGRVGVWIPDPASLLVEPQGYTITARVKPTGGTDWHVTVGGGTVLPDVVDLVAVSSVGPVSPSVTASFDARLYALETEGGVDVGQVVEDYLDAAVPPAVDAAVAPHIAQVQQISGLTGEDGAVAHLIGTDGSLSHQAVTDLVGESASIVVTEEGQPAPPMRDGQILVTVRKAASRYVETFADAPIGSPPPGWTARGTAAGWQVVADPEAVGGKALTLPTQHHIARRWLSWDAPSEDVLRRDIDILMRVWVPEGSNYNISAIARASQDLANGVGQGVLTGWLGSSAVGPAEQGAFRDGRWTRWHRVDTPTPAGWHRLRATLSGDTVAFAVWADGEDETEPLTFTDPTAIRPGEQLVGVMYAQPSKGSRLDWISVATGRGHRAVEPS